MLLSVSDLQPAAAGDEALCVDEDVQKPVLARSALYHVSNTCLLLKHRNIYFLPFFFFY